MSAKIGESNIAHLGKNNIAFINLVSDEGRDRSLRVGVLDISYRTRLIEDGLQRMEFPVQVRLPYVGHVAADYLGNEQDEKPSLFAELGPIALPVRFA